MGSMFAEDLAGGGLGLTLEGAISLHLTSNHYPPVPTSMVAPCVEAIEAINEGDSDRLITLPDGVYWRGEEEAPAWALAEAHHLDAWLYDEEGE
jgi:hypothetical protein